MTQAELEREIAQTTGEDLREVRRRGFSLASVELDLDQDDRHPLVLDWDVSGASSMPELTEIGELLGWEAEA